MPEVTKGKYLVSAGWNDVPHLDKDDMKVLLDSTPLYLQKARSEGIPSMGAGAIYPYERRDVEYTPDFEIPPHWPRGYALDVGWNRTAALWGAWDRDSDIVYIYSEHYRSDAEPPIHADAIRARGYWIPGVIDPAARGRSQIDGHNLFDIYLRLGLSLDLANNAVEAGIYEVQQRLSSGRVKIASNLPNFWFEYGLYGRDLKGKIVKENDHLMDCFRYLLTKLVNMKVMPMEMQGIPMRPRSRDVNRTTGY
jgi:hypothetical protein